MREGSHHELAATGFLSEIAIVKLEEINERTKPRPQEENGDGTGRPVHQADRRGAERTRKRTVAKNCPIERALAREEKSSTPNAGAVKKKPGGAGETGEDGAPARAG